jgi:hypothetical protein
MFIYFLQYSLCIFLLTSLAISCRVRSYDNGHLTVQTDSIVEVERIVVVHGVSTGSKVAPTLRSVAKSNNIPVEIIHLQIGDLSPALAASYNAADYDINLHFDDVDSAMPTLISFKSRLQLIAGSEESVLFVDELNSRLGAGKSDPELSIAKRDKEQLYRLLQQSGLNKAPFVGVSSKEEALELLHKHSMDFPLILKPVDDAGGRHLYVVRNSDDLERALSSLFSAQSRTMFGDPIRRVLVQSQLQGQEIAVQGVTWGNEVLITDVIEYTKSDAVYELDQLADPRSPRTIRAAEYTRKVLARLGIQNTAFHVEVFDDPRFGLVAVDVAARAMGGVDHMMVKEATGYNQIDALVDAVLHRAEFQRRVLLQKEGPLYSVQKSGYVLDFIQHQGGTVMAEPDVAFLKSLPTYAGHKTSLKVGDTVGSTTDLLNTGGALWLVGDPKQLEIDRKKFRDYERSGKFIQVDPCEVIRSELD